MCRCRWLGLGPCSVWRSETCVRKCQDSWLFFFFFKSDAWHLINKRAQRATCTLPACSTRGAKHPPTVFKLFFFFYQDPVQCCYSIYVLVCLETMATLILQSKLHRASVQAQQRLFFFCFECKADNEPIITFNKRNSFFSFFPEAMIWLNKKKSFWDATGCFVNHAVLTFGPVTPCGWNIFFKQLITSLYEIHPILRPPPRSIDWTPVKPQFASSYQSFKLLTLAAMKGNQDQHCLKRWNWSPEVVDWVRVACNFRVSLEACMDSNLCASQRSDTASSGFAFPSSHFSVSGGGGGNGWTTLTVVLWHIAFTWHWLVEVTEKGTKNKKNKTQGGRDCWDGDTHMYM